MDFRKITAAAASAALIAAAGTVSVSAVDPINAKLGYTDTNWTFQDWESSVQVTGDGQYTITSTAVAGTEEIGVFVIDLEGMYAAYPEATATLDKIEVDGAEVSFDASKILYGDIEEKGNFRIDIYNMYSDTKDDPGFNSATPISESLSVTFTVSGLGGGEAAPAAEEAPAETEAAPAEPAAVESTGETDVPPTGNTPYAVVAGLMAVAAAAAFAARKR
ncbi:MAG: hypothetical protein J6F31_06465 [Oscillospiraceae bacterium]|nr:hypothetical protein [Oscillospiraceae bacterium]